MSWSLYVWLSCMKPPAVGITFFWFFCFSVFDSCQLLSSCLYVLFSSHLSYQYKLYPPISGKDFVVRIAIDVLNLPIKRQGFLESANYLIPTKVAMPFRSFKLSLFSLSRGVRSWDQWVPNVGKYFCVSWCGPISWAHLVVASDTVDGQNPAPARMMMIPLFIGF